MTQTSTPCPLEHDLEDVNVRKVVEECHRCSLDICIARIEACVKRATVEFMNRNAARRLNQQECRP
jgi:hypothetical protein